MLEVNDIGTNILSNNNNIPFTLLLQAFSAANLGFILLDSNKKIIFWNDWMASHSGLSRDDVLGNNLLAVFPKIDSPRLDSALHDCFVNSMSSILSPRLHPHIFPLKTIQSKDAIAKSVGQMVTIFPLKSEEGELYSMIQIADVTAALVREDILRGQSRNLASEVEKRTQELQLEIRQHEQTEISLRESEKQFRSLYENAPNAYCSVSIEDGSITRFNQQMVTLSGYSEQELKGFRISELYSDTDSGIIPGIKIFKRLKKGKSTLNSEVQLVRGDGRNIWSSISAHPMLDSDGNVAEGRYSILDISDSHQNQYNLLQISKLASLGEMATGIAHELNQPLNIIRMSADSLIETLEDEDDIGKDVLAVKLERIASQTGRAAAIIDHIRIFGRKSDDGLAPISINEIVQRVNTFMADQLRLDDISLIKNIPEKCRFVNGSQIQMEQVIMNIVTNARDAINSRKENDSANMGSGKIFIGIDDDASSDRIKIVINDNGGGIPKDISSRIFEPFFTTKKAGHGTGLGLSLSYGLIAEVGGDINAENVADGAQFTITLPVIPQT